MKAVSVKPNEEYYRRRSLLIIKEQARRTSRASTLHDIPHMSANQISKITLKACI